MEEKEGYGRGSPVYGGFHKYYGEFGLVRLGSTSRAYYWDIKRTVLKSTAVYFNVLYFRYHWLPWGLSPLASLLWLRYVVSFNL